MFRRETSPIIRPARAASSRARIRDPARMQTTSPVSDSSIGVDDLAIDDDGSSDEVSLDGLQVELEECMDDNDEIGSISSEISLQEKSMDMGLKLKNLKGAESKLARFLEDIIIPPRLINIIVDGEVNDEYMKNLELLSRKLKFVQADPMVKSPRALKDVQLELERIRQKAVSKFARDAYLV